MQSFCDLIKPNNISYWDGTLESIFLKSKHDIIEKVKDEEVKENDMEVIWAPVYSPWYQPVEYYISQVKRMIKRERLADLVNNKERTVRYLI